MARVASLVNASISDQSVAGIITSLEGQEETLNISYFCCYIKHMQGAGGVKVPGTKPHNTV